MTEESTTIPVSVSCYAGYKGEETPRRFKIREREINILEILDRWLAPDYRYFKIRGDDNSIYILRHDPYAGTWEMTFYKTIGASLPAMEDPDAR